MEMRHYITIAHKYLILYHKLKRLNLDRVSFSKAFSRSLDFTFYYQPLYFMEQNDPVLSPSRALFSARGCPHGSLYCQSCADVPWRGPQGGRKALRLGTQASSLRLEVSWGWSRAGLPCQTGTPQREESRVSPLRPAGTITSGGGRAGLIPFRTQEHLAKS